MIIKKATNLDEVEQIVVIHLTSFPDFFLTFLGKGFLKYLYKGFIQHSESGILVAQTDSCLVGFLAYSTNLSEFYSFLIKKYFFPFAWYGFLGALRSPKNIFRIVRAMTYPNISKKNEKAIEISSIAVNVEKQSIGIGSKLVDELVNIYSDSEYTLIRLQTDALNNDRVNQFYKKKGFELIEAYLTPEKRLMNQYVLQLK